MRLIENVVLKNMPSYCHHHSQYSQKHPLHLNPSENSKFLQKLLVSRQVFLQEHSVNKSMKKKRLVYSKIALKLYAKVFTDKKKKRKKIKNLEIEVYSALSFEFPRETNAMLFPRGVQLFTDLQSRNAVITLLLTQSYRLKKVFQT